MANLTEGKVYKGEIALGRTRRDGVLSIRGPYGKAAELTTKPLIFRGDELWLNVDASGGGAVTVAVTSAVNTTAIRRCCSLNCVSDTRRCAPGREAPARAVGADCAQLGAGEGRVG